MTTAQATRTVQVLTIVAYEDVEDERGDVQRRKTPLKSYVLDEPHTALDLIHVLTSHQLELEAAGAKFPNDSLFATALALVNAIPIDTVLDRNHEIIVGRIAVGRIESNEAFLP